jgi:tellurite resistance protein TehA-like permease
LARRGSVIGLLIVMGYAFQAMYGGGVNHIRHIFGDFRGSQFLPVLLNAVGIQVTDIRGHGFWTVLMGMAGLGITPPHQHILASTLVAFINIGLNAALILFCALALYAWYHARRPAQAASAKRTAVG